MTAVVLSGGSWLGLSAVTGVADEIRVMRTDSVTPPRIQGVVGAIINDLGSGITRRRFSMITPDPVLGRAAIHAARPGKFFLGARGGGRFAKTGGIVMDRSETSGEGGAFRQIGPTKIAVFTVVNAAGVVVDRNGQIVRCRQMHWGEKCGSANARLSKLVDSLTKLSAIKASTELSTHTVPTDNTTISLVVTNQKLAWSDLNRLAVQVHTSMGRGIQPFASISDGDVLYAVTTEEVDNPQLSASQLALVASEVAWDAILASVPKADPQVSTTAMAIDATTLDDFAGQYELGPGSRMKIGRSGNTLTADSDNGGIYVGKGAVLTPIGRDEFLISGVGHNMIRFNRDKNRRVTGLVTNPGNWPIPASRRD